MNKWESEEEIKPHLRELTGEVRKLRSEMDDMLRAPQPKAEHRYLHRQPWPKPPTSVNDHKRKKSR